MTVCWGQHSSRLKSYIKLGCWWESSACNSSAIRKTKKDLPNDLNHISPMRAHKTHSCDPLQFANSFLIWNSDAAWLQILLFIICLPYYYQNMKSHYCIYCWTYHQGGVQFLIYSADQKHAFYLIDIWLIPKDLSGPNVTYRLLGHGFAGTTKKWPSQAVCFQMLSYVRMTLYIS